MPNPISEMYFEYNYEGGNNYQHDPNMTVEFDGPIRSSGITELAEPISRSRPSTSNFVIRRALSVQPNRVQMSGSRNFQDFKTTQNVYDNIPELEVRETDHNQSNSIENTTENNTDNTTVTQFANTGDISWNTFPRPGFVRVLPEQKAYTSRLMYFSFPFRPSPTPQEVQAQYLLLRSYLGESTTTTTPQRYFNFENVNDVIRETNPPNRHSELASTFPLLYAPTNQFPIDFSTLYPSIMTPYTDTDRARHHARRLGTINRLKQMMIRILNESNHPRTTRTQRHRQNRRNGRNHQHLLLMSPPQPLLLMPPPQPLLLMPPSHSPSISLLPSSESM